jgi:hypothetical protein
MENILPEIVERDIHQLPISRSLTAMMQMNNLTTLKELLATPLNEWFEFNGFNQHNLNELMNYLEKSKLAGHIKD